MRGSCLRHLRTRAGLSSEEVARVIDRSAGHLRALERADKEIELSLTAWTRLAELLGVPINKLPR